MDVKEAIQLAKEYIADIYMDEGVFNVGLEEIEFNAGTWEVTVGFSRRWDRAPKSIFTAAAGQEQDTAALRRTYKIVQIKDDTEEIVSVSNRAGIM